MKGRHVFSTTHHFHESLDCWTLVTSHSSLVTRATWNGWISIGSLIIAVISYIYLNFITYVEKHFQKSLLRLTVNRKQVSRRRGAESELCNAIISNNLQIIIYYYWKIFLLISLQAYVIIINFAPFQMKSHIF